MTDELEPIVEGEGLSIRDELAAALGAEPAAPAPVIDAAQSVPTGQEPAATDNRSRDEQGRFAPKPAEAQISKPETPQAGTEPAPQPAQTIMPPPSWSATAKAKFPTLDPDIREEVLKREGDIERGKAQWDQKAERLNRLDTVLGPRAESLRLKGLDEVQAVQMLFAAQDYLERDPFNALAYLARQSGVDFRQFAQAMAQGQPPQEQMPPQLQGLVQKVQTLEQAWTQQQQAAQHTTRQTFLDQVQQFTADPANLYFENVRHAMAALLRAEQATDLKDAYQKAIWADPTIRPLLLEQQDRERQERERAAAGAKVQQARAASGSVTGSPSPGANTQGQGASPATVRDALMQAWDAHAA